MTRSPLTGTGRTAAVALLLVASTLWTTAVVAAPYVVSHGPGPLRIGQAAGLVYAAGSLVCHQRPDRSYHPWGAQVPVCARCLGIYLAVPLGVALVLAGRRRRPAPDAEAARATWRRIVLLACLPTALTVLWEWTTGDRTPDLVRAVAGVALGGPVAAFLAAALLGDVQ